MICKFVLLTKIKIMNEKNQFKRSSNKSGYFISVSAGIMSSGIVNGWGLTIYDLAGLLGGLLAVLLFAGIISGTIYLFYRKNFQTIFTIACAIFSILAALGGLGVRLF